ncbi:YggS family pyridoxal phosphate-dependent enzyme, partial [Klebsiella pneumoniae]
KQAELSDLPLAWHFIGPIQSNKTKSIAEHFDWVHSVDRLKIAQRLSDQRPTALPPLNICLQVNVSGEASKSGCAPEELPQLAQAVAAMPHLRLRGLMCIPA